MTGVQMLLLRRPCMACRLLLALALLRHSGASTHRWSRKGGGGICGTWLDSMPGIVCLDCVLSGHMMAVRGPPGLPRWLRRRAVQGNILGAAAGRRTKAAQSRLYLLPGRVQALQHLCAACSEMDIFVVGAPTARPACYNDPPMRCSLPRPSYWTLVLRTGSVHTSLYFLDQERARLHFSHYTMLSSSAT